MRSIECDGESIDEAIEKALRMLDVSREQARIEILNDATRGLFGFGGSKARVRAVVRAPIGTYLDQDRPNDSRETIEPPPADDGRVSDAEPVMVSSRTPTRPAVPPSEAFQVRCRTLLEEILSRLGASCTVVARSGSEPGTVQLDVSGDSGGLLIGRRGQTLDALEYIVNRIVGRDEDSATVRVMIDVEHYRERRREYLTSLASRLADKAKHTGRPVTLNPMSPRDRRIVHLALQGDPSVATRSDGEGHFRRLLILPAGGRRGARPRPSSN
jgi:spoIIIJ-associated protein